MTDVPSTPLDRQAHWDERYTTIGATEVSWYEPAPTMSLDVFDAVGVTARSSVIDVGGGASHLVATSQAGQYFTVAAWLNNSTLLLQSNGLNCNPACTSALWAVGVDGSNLTKVADGTFVTIIGSAQN